MQTQMNQLNEISLNQIYTPNELRTRFTILAFLTDTEIDRLLSVVQTVSLATAIDPVVILEHMSRQADTIVAQS